MAQKTINLETEEFKQELIDLIYKKNGTLPFVNVATIVKQVSDELQSLYPQILEADKKQYEAALKEEKEK